MTPEEVAYRDGYVEGSIQENQAHEDFQESQLHREELRLRQAQQVALSNSHTTTGVFFGMVLAILAALIGGILWTTNRSGNEGTEPQPQGSEVPVRPDTPQSDTPQSDTTIIERTIERTQEVIPAPTRGSQPDINIVVPTSPQPTQQANPPTQTPESNETSPPATEATTEPEENQQ
ncbi:hypothetical protein [Leptolyngbya sp. PCC 6406]|uniref:hypothetical protein n=1 Tax=Leptolyngbya sp. PCC 6406 TaxID=1173264 RepID=UPI000301FB4D|nr:hypothetical protein [Leptolyngbya sp. PCC 6406]